MVDIELLKQTFDKIGIKYKERESKSLGPTMYDYKPGELMQVISIDGDGTDGIGFDMFTWFFFDLKGKFINYGTWE